MNLKLRLVAPVVWLCDSHNWSKHDAADSQHWVVIVGSQFIGYQFRLTCHLIFPLCQHQQAIGLFKCCLAADAQQCKLRLSTSTTMLPWTKHVNCLTCSTALKKGLLHKLLASAVAGNVFFPSLRFEKIPTDHVPTCRQTQWNWGGEEKQKQKRKG